MKPSTSGHPNTIRRSSWIYISGIAFLLALGASAVFIIYGKRLEDLGITGNIYYIILIPLGFSCAAFLAGAMKSYASFKSNENFTYGQLNLTGPVVIFALVVGGGFILPNLNKKPPFEIKVRIISNDKPSKEFNEGLVTLYIGKEPKNVNIHEGEATFYNIPLEFNNKIVQITPSIDEYQADSSDQVLISNKEDYVNIHVSRTKQSLSTQIRGTILSQKNAPIKNALLNFGSGLVTGRTDALGDFLLTIPLPAGSKVTLKILVDSVIMFNEDVTVSASTPINIKLAAVTH
jgi:hypothetical protein